jgi:hypothetical protein
LRIDGARSLLRLPGSSGSYEVDGTQYAATRITTPRAAGFWLAFQADIVHRRSPEGGADFVTSAAFRVGNGVAWYGWDGAWIADGPWISAAVLSEHLSTFPIGPIGFQVRMSTSDERVAPVLQAIRLAIGFKPQYGPLDDYVWRSLLRSARANIRPIGRIDLKWPGGQIGDFSTIAPYVPTEGVAAHDVGDGSDEEGVNVLAAYNPATKKVTLSGPVSAGRFVRFYFRHTPQFAAVSTSLDFAEANSSPSVTIRNVKLRDAGAGGSDQAINAHNGIGVFVPAPRLCDVTFDVELGAGREWDIAQLQEEAGRWLADGAKLISTGLDEAFDVRIESHFTAYDFTEIRGLRRGSLSAAVLSAVFFDRPHTPAYAVKNVTFASNAPAGTTYDPTSDPDTEGPAGTKKKQRHTLHVEIKS